MGPARAADALAEALEVPLSSPRRYGWTLATGLAAAAAIWPSSHALSGIYSMYDIDTTLVGLLPFMALPLLIASFSLLARGGFGRAARRQDLALRVADRLLATGVPPEAAVSASAFVSALPLEVVRSLVDVDAPTPRADVALRRMLHALPAGRYDALAAGLSGAAAAWVVIVFWLGYALAIGWAAQSSWGGQ